MIFRRMSQDHVDEQSTLVQEKGLGHSGYKPLPEPMFNQNDVGI